MTRFIELNISDPWSDPEPILVAVDDVSSACPHVWTSVSGKQAVGCELVMRSPQYGGGQQPLAVPRRLI